MKLKSLEDDSEWEVVSKSLKDDLIIRPIQKKQWEVTGLDTTIALTVDSSSLEQMKAIKDCVESLLDVLISDNDRNEFKKLNLSIDKARELLGENTE